MDDPLFHQERELIQLIEDRLNMYRIVCLDVGKPVRDRQMHLSS